MGRKRRIRSASQVVSAAGHAAENPPAALLEALWHFRGKFRTAREPEKVLRGALKLSLEVFSASEGCFAFVRPGSDLGEILFSEPRQSCWDTLILGGFLRGYDVSVPRDTMLCRIRRRGRMWGALAIRTPHEEFSWRIRQAFSMVGDVVNDLLVGLDDHKVRDVRSRIDRKVLDQLQPKNLFYKLLHGIRSLTDYDHSAALLIWDETDESLEIVAEQISYHKSKSYNVGLKLSSLPAGIREVLNSDLVLGFDRQEGHWSEWSGRAATELAELLDYNPQRPSTQLPVAENAMLCAPLVTQEGLLGVLKVAAVHPGALGPYEADLVWQFLPQAAVALRNLRHNESLQGKILEAERRNAMADLARGVAHDINNALGTVVPLVQQLRADLEEDAFDAATAVADLHEIERAMLVCRRVFAGMLQFARSHKRNRSEVHLGKVIETAMAIYQRPLQRTGIAVSVDVPPGLPPILAVQADIEQLVLNLVSNARDAMASGDQLTITACETAAAVQLAVADTGCGISPENLRRIQEPFFTTKRTGTGLGLALCHSIVAQNRGKLHIDSHLGQGTIVRVVLPLSDGEQP